MIFKLFIIVAGSFLPFLMRCGDISTPELDGKEIDTVPIISFQFIPKQKYLAPGEWATAKVTYFPGFQCSQIIELNIHQKENILWPQIKVSSPTDFNQCPVIQSEGVDTLIQIKWLEKPDNYERIFLSLPSRDTTDSSNSQFQLIADDSITLVSSLPKDTNIVMTFKDTVWLKDSKGEKEKDKKGNYIVDTVLTGPVLLDSISLPCGDSISQAFYCSKCNFNKVRCEKDTLWLQLKIVRFSLSICETISQIRYLPDSNYFHKVPMKEHCLTGLEHFRDSLSTLNLIIPEI